MSIESRIRTLADNYAANLKRQMLSRVDEMASDDVSHHLVYRVLGVTSAEGHLIDVYQNKGRFLYKYAGSFLEEAAKLCFLETFPESKSVLIPNSSGTKPAKFEIDCLLDGTDALEIKWRDATTDGDHITKEHTRIQVIKAAGYKPVRIMFYYPIRSQAIKIQNTLQTLYSGVEGEYYFGDSAWGYVLERTGVDLKSILSAIANERDLSNEHQEVL